MHDKRSGLGLKRGLPYRAPARTFGLIVLFLHAACAKQAPLRGQVGGENRWRPPSAKEDRAAQSPLEPVVVVFIEGLKRQDKRIVALTDHAPSEAAQFDTTHEELHAVLERVPWVVM